MRRSPRPGTLSTEPEFWSAHRCIAAALAQVRPNCVCGRSPLATSRKGRCSRWALRCREVAQSAFGHSRSATWRPMLAVLALQEALTLALRPREAVLHRFTPGVAEAHLGQRPLREDLLRDLRWGGPS